MLRIVKLGGSILTYKGSKIGKLRRAHLLKIGAIIKQWLNNGSNKKIQSDNFSDKLILVLGVGSFGHPLAKKYNLRKGLNPSLHHFEKWQGALETHLEVARFLNEVSKILLSCELPIYPISPACIKTSKNLQTEIIKEALEKNLIPVLHGDIVFSGKNNVEIYSGDTIIMDLAKYFDADEIHFITKGQGILFEGKTVEKISSIELKSKLKKISAKTNYQDVTSGFLGKIKACLEYIPPDGIKIYDGTNVDNIRKGFLALKIDNKRQNNFIGTLITE